MAAPSPQHTFHYSLDDRYDSGVERVFLTGTQALVRVVLEQARRDREAGRRTAGFVSGYRGSPLGNVDLEMWRARQVLQDQGIEFLPAVNEDLAATAVLGSQQVETNPQREVEGVFALWYGKGPGVDRAGDALKHGNAYGSSPTGGVLVVAGDDHGCVSSSMPHQSDVAFMTFFMPVLNPANVEEYLSYGEYGYALSRYTGMWVGFKAISETVESAASVIVRPPRRFVTPDFQMPPDGLHYRWPDMPGPQIEERLEAKKHATLAFARANPIDRRLFGIDDATFGIVTTGKGHLDLMEALRLLGLDEAACRRLGIDIYKVGMVWPLALRDALKFVEGKREILVIEEKRGIIESQFKEYFYDYPGAKPDCMVGKHDERGERLVPWIGELSPSLLAPIVARRLDAIFPDLQLSERAERQRPGAERIIAFGGAKRTPYFCSGCPHNTSTKVPDGSQALAGIGCHFMASWMDRETTSLIQMGGEGVNWVASSKFTGRGHIFQNLGEGTYYHSGSVAIRQAIAAGTNITYKILYNDAVAMTGGQPVDGPISVHAIAHSVRAEGVARIALVSDQPRKFRKSDFPAGLTLHHRRELDAVQRELREVSGVSVLIYEQACATEKRRRRKRGTLDDPARFAYINPLVCEGCGDCSVESNCLSIEPRETRFGRKRQINLSNCNKDFSCLNGFCPSFVTIEGGTRRRGSGADELDVTTMAAQLPAPQLPALESPYNLLVTGVGGTGIITLGALVTMAAHLDGHGASVLDFTGFAQKFGPVLSFIRLGRVPADLHQVRIDRACADALIGCDVVVSSSPQASTAYRQGMQAIVNTASMPTGDMVRHRDTDLAVDSRLQRIERVAGANSVASFDANDAALKLLGDSVFANVMLLGFAWQRGLVPVSLVALRRAVELNGVAVEQNLRALAFGQVAAVSPDWIADALGTAPAAAPSLTQMIDERAQFLREYQNAAWAERYRAQVARVQALEHDTADPVLTRAVARSLFKLMAYKDEYEVARLHLGRDFLDELSQQFEGKYRVHYHMAPPLLPLGRDARGRPRKREFGQWLRWPMRLLARLRFLRGTPFDAFGYTSERRAERALIDWYDDLIERMVARPGDDPAAHWHDIAQAPMDIRGYGPVKEEAMARVRASVQQMLESMAAEAGIELAG